MTREISLIGSAYGTAVPSSRMNVVAGREVSHRGSWASSSVGVPYAPKPVEDRSKKCSGETANGPCGSYHTKDSDLCVGHQKKLAAVAEEGVKTDDESPATP
jgi:hypothetical protein